MERGLSLSALGRGLRWSDVRALVLHLPATSYFRQVENPQAARIAQWTTPQAQLLGLLIDQHTGWPDGYVPVVQRVLAAQEPEPEVTTMSKPLTAAEIRARVLG